MGTFIQPHVKILLPVWELMTPFILRGNLNRTLERALQNMAKLQNKDLEKNKRMPTRHPHSH
jgi:hypothetical protein